MRLAPGLLVLGSVLLAALGVFRRDLDLLCALGCVLAAVTIASAWKKRHVRRRGQKEKDP